MWCLLSRLSGFFLSLKSCRTAKRRKLGQRLFRHLQMPMSLTSFPAQIPSLAWERQATALLSSLRLSAEKPPSFPQISLRTLWDMPVATTGTRAVPATLLAPSHTNMVTQKNNGLGLMNFAVFHPILLCSVLLPNRGCIPSIYTCTGCRTERSGSL